MYIASKLSSFCNPHRFGSTSSAGLTMSSIAQPFTGADETTIFLVPGNMFGKLSSNTRAWSVTTFIEKLFQLSDEWIGALRWPLEPCFLLDLEPWRDPSIPWDLASKAAKILRALFSGSVVGVWQLYKYPGSLHKYYDTSFATFGTVRSSRPTEEAFRALAATANDAYDRGLPGVCWALDEVHPDDEQWLRRAAELGVSHIVGRAVNAGGGAE